MQECSFPWPSDSPTAKEEYFKGLRWEIEHGGGRESLFQFLMDRDTSQFNPRCRPSGEMDVAYANQKLFSLAPVPAFLHSFLQEPGQLTNDCERTRTIVNCQDFYQQFSRWCKDNGERKVSSSVFGTQLKLWAQVPNNMITKDHPTQEGGMAR